MVALLTRARLSSDTPACLEGLADRSSSPEHLEDSMTSNDEEGTAWVGSAVINYTSIVLRGATFVVKKPTGDGAKIQDTKILAKRTTTASLTFNHRFRYLMGLLE